MFPNVRLMIAALVASVVALSCGFGVFAAFRVNHEPLARLRTPAAPLQLIAGNTAAIIVAAGESLDYRFQTGPQLAAYPAADSTTPGRDDQRTALAPAATAAPVPEGDAAATETTAAVAAAGASPVAPPSPVVPPAAGPTANAVAPPADDQTLDTSAPAPPADAARAETPSSSQQTPAVVMAPPADQAVAAEPAKPDSAVVPASVTKTVRVLAHRRKAGPRPRRARILAAISGAHRARATEQYRDQDSAFSQWDYQNTNQLRHAKDDSKPQEDTTAVVDVPFVSRAGR